MKIFISGSKILKDHCKNDALSDSVIVKLDRIMDDADEILIGDCIGTDALVQKYLHEKQYRNVTVYVLGNKNWTRNNIGSWEEKHFGVHVTNGYRKRLEKDLHMAEESDAGVAVWDGESKGTFVNMVCLAAQGKVCDVYLLNEKRWIEICSLEYLLQYADPAEGWNAEDIEKTLGICGFSDEMKDYLVTEHLISGFTLVDIVCRAPIPLDEKCKAFELLGRNKGIFKQEILNAALKNAQDSKNWDALKTSIRKLADWKCEYSLSSYLGFAWQELCKAKQEILCDYDFDERLLYLFAEWYDTDSYIEKSIGVGMFKHLNSALNYVNREEADNDTGEGWYRVETWETTDSAWEKNRYDFYIFDGNVCWFEKLYPKKQEHGNIYYMPESRRFSSGKLDFDLRTPFVTGDIVLMDCRPFGPPFHAMILEARDQWDCCFPTIVFHVPYTDKWRMTSLKHRKFFKHSEVSFYAPMLSPLYRIRRVLPEEMTEEDRELMKLSKLLSGDESKAEAVWAAWDKYTAGDKSFEDVETVFMSAGVM